MTTTTYYSVQESNLPEPSSQSEAIGSSTATGYGASNTRGVTAKRSRPSRRDGADKHPTAFEMVRQDSGYESSFTNRRDSSSSKRPRKSSKATSSPSDPVQKRPGFRRTAASTPMARMPRSSLTIDRPSFLTPQQQSNLNRKNSYFRFPAPENLDHEDDQAPRTSVDLAPVILQVNTANLESNQSPDPAASRNRAWSNSPISPFVVPPPTTHYWNDHTRQLEYAAIDAAGKGVRGWIMRNVVPDCFVPRSNRRAGFDDDGGSVRRYRIELEVECPEDSVPPSPVGEKLRGFRLRDAKKSWWARLRGCNA